MIIRSTKLALILIFLGWTNVLAQPASKTVHKRQCKPIARVLNNNDQYWTVRSLLCEGDWLDPQPGKKVEVFCYANGVVLRLANGAVSNQCVLIPKQQAQQAQCKYDNRLNCPKVKGPSDRDTPALIVPYSSTLLNQKPNFSWYSVASATSYKVQVTGMGVNWEKEVVTTDLLYPQEQPAMRFGNAYKITIIAIQNGSPTKASVAALNLLPQQDAQQVRKIVKQINNLGIPKDEAAFLDLDRLYMSKNLLHETIGSLESRVKTGSRNPTLYRVLGDRYLEAGLPESAKREYTRATTWAKRVDNSAELAKAEAGLQRVAIYSQLPTRTNGDQ